MSKTIYRIDESPSGEPLSGPIAPGERSPSRRRTLVWVLAVLLAVTLVMIAVLAALGATDSGATGTSYKPIAPSTDSVPGTATTQVSDSISVTTDTVSAASSSTSSSGSTSTTVYTHAIEPPVRIVIPAIKLDTGVVGVGLQPDKSMEIPKVGLVGWYNLGPAPGASGPAVVVSHVSWQGKKGSFYYLRQLKAGDKVFIYDASGDFATFQVDSRETVPKTELPKEKIWSNTKDPVIRLVTCGGEYDSATGHYLSNVIVYGHLVK